MEVKLSKVVNGEKTVITIEHDTIKKLIRDLQKERRETHAKISLYPQTRLPNGAVAFNTGIDFMTYKGTISWFPDGTFFGR